MIVEPGAALATSDDKVRSSELDPKDPLTRQWVVTVVGSDTAEALVAHPFHEAIAALDEPFGSRRGKPHIVETTDGLVGWGEVTIVIRFWLISAVFAAVGLGIFYAEWITG